MPASASDSYEAIILNEEQAELLNCSPGCAGFFHQRVTRTENGQVFEFTQAVIRGDKVKLDVSMQKDGFIFKRNFQRL
jgi:GntR family transcriptional regulator